MIQSVSLFGSETWVFSAPISQRLEVVRVELLRYVTKLKSKRLRYGL